jgi:hypothetical protein
MVPREIVPDDDFAAGRISDEKIIAVTNELPVDDERGLRKCKRAASLRGRNDDRAGVSNESRSGTSGPLMMM